MTSNKIPVGRVIKETFGFAFGRYFTVLGITWLPTLLIVAAVYVMLHPFLASFAQLATLKQMMNGSQPPVAIPNTGLLWLCEIAIFFLYAWIGVGVAKEILGLRTGPRFVYLPGKDELHALLSLFVVFLIAYAAIVAVTIVALVIGVIVVLAMGGANANFSPQALKALLPWGILFLVVVEIVFIYVLIRLTHLIIPYTVTKKRIVLFDSWTTMRGNVLRALIIGLVCSLPFIAIEAVLAVMFIVPVMVQVASLPDPSQTKAVLDTAIHQWAQYFPLYVAALAALAPFLAGLMGAPAIFAYRAIVPPSAAAQK